MLDGFANEFFQMHVMLFWSMTFLNMKNFQVIVLRVIEHVRFVMKIHHMSNWNLEGRQCIF